MTTTEKPPLLYFALLRLSPAGEGGRGAKKRRLNAYPVVETIGPGPCGQKSKRGRGRKPLVQSKTIWQPSFSQKSVRETCRLAKTSFGDEDKDDHDDDGNDGDARD